MRTTARLTGQGYGALALGAAMVWLGLALGYPGVVGFGATLVGVVAAALLTLLKLPALRVQREAGPAAPRRLDECTITLAVSNRGQHPASLDGFELMDGVKLPVEVPYLSPGRKIHVRYPLPTDRRGPVVLGPLRLQRIGLAGLAVGIASPPARHTVTVMPRVLPATVPGPLSVLIDNRTAGYPPERADLDEAVDVAASLAAAATAAGFPYSLATMSGQIDARSDVFEALALLRPVAGRVRAPGQLGANGGIAVGVTGAAGDPKPLLEALSGAGSAVLLVVDTRPAQMATLAGNVLVLRAPRAEELLIAWDEIASGLRVEATVPRTSAAGSPDTARLSPEPRAGARRGKLPNLEVR
jgi:uncharacterized protein (DUF58 family)